MFCSSRLVNLFVREAGSVGGRGRREEREGGTEEAEREAGEERKREYI